MSSFHLTENVNYIPQEKFEQILDYVKNNLETRKLDNIDIQMIFKIAYYSGLRINEVLKLTKSNFDFELLQIDLGNTKTKKHDRATIPKSFMVELETYLITERSNLGKSDLLFPISRQMTYNWIMKIGKDLNVTAWTTPQNQSGEKTKTHIFRKSIGKDMIKRGAPLNVIMNKLRHNNLATTSEYLKLNLSDVQKWENQE